VKKALTRNVLLLALVLFGKINTAHAQSGIDKGTPQDKQSSGKLAAKDATTAALPFKIGSPLSRTLQTLTGVTPLTQFILDQTLQTALHHQLAGKIKVKIRLWSLTDLLAGKIKGAKLSLSDSSYKGVPLGRIEAKVNAPVQLTYFASSKRKKKLALSAPLLVSLKVKVKEKDVALALENAKVASSLRALRLDLPGLGQQQLEVLDPRVNLDNDLITINGVLVTKGASPDTGVPLTLSGNLKLKGDETIVLENAAVESTTVVDPEHFAQFLQDLLNPIISLHRFDKPNRAVRLDSLAIAKGFVTAEGRVILAP
jgi:hypothetical protein